MPYLSAPVQRLKKCDIDLLPEILTKIKGVIMKKPLSKAIKRFYGIADLGFSFMTQVETQFFAPFLTDYAMFSLPVSGLIMSITSTFDAVFASLPGFIIDRSNMRWGRYRSWLLVGPPLVVILYPFQYTKFGTEVTAAIIICAAFIISHIIWNIFWVSNLSLISVLSSTPEERMLLSSHRTQYSSISRMCFSYIGLPLILFFGAKTGNDIAGFYITALIMTLFMWICYTIVFKITDGYEDVTAKNEPKKAQEKTSFLDMIKIIVANPPLLVHMLTDLMRGIGTNIISSLAFYYYTYTIGDRTLMTLHLLVVAVAAFVGALCVPLIAKVFKDSKKRYLFYTLALCCSLLLARFANANMPFYMASIAVSQFFQQSLAATNPLMYSNTIVYGEWKHGKNLAGLVMGFSNLPLKMGIIFRGVSVATGLGFFGFVANTTPTPEVQQGIVTLMTVVPAISIGIGALICMFFYPLTDKRVAELQSDINSRKAEQTA